MSLICDRDPGPFLVNSADNL